MYNVSDQKHTNLLLTETPHKCFLRKVLAHCTYVTYSNEKVCQTIGKNIY